MCLENAALTHPTPEAVVGPMAGVAKLVFPAFSGKGCLMRG